MTEKSKLPDLKEVTGMAKKFFGDIKTSVTEIAGEYKSKRDHADAEPAPKTAAKKSSPPPPTESKDASKSEEPSSDK